MPRSTPAQRQQAVRMHAEGKTLAQIGAACGGFSYQTVRKWLDPEVRETANRKALAYRKANRKRLNAAAALYMRSHKGHACPQCGEPLKNLKTKRCRACRRVETENLWEEIQTLWLKGRTSGQIAIVLERHPGTIKVHITRMRAAGWDMPRRKCRISC